MRQLEHEHAKALMRWVRLNEFKFPELRVIYAIPNGGQRHAAVAGKMKAEGQKPGIPDYHLPVARKGYHSLYVELKTETGKPTRKQLEIHEELRSHGNRVEVAHGWESATAIIEEYLTWGAS